MEKRAWCLSVAVVAAVAASGTSNGARTLAGGVTYVSGSTVKVCQPAGQTDNETGKPIASQTESRFGLESADRGYTFDFDGRVWWLFGDSRPTPTFNGNANAAARYPKYKAGIDNDSLASSVPTPPGKCPKLNFVTERLPVPGAYANPSASLHTAPIDLRANESPVAGVEVGGRMYVTFATDNPKDVGRKSNCPPGQGSTCFGLPTRSVMTVLADEKTARFQGLYNLSAPPRPYASGAKFVQVATVRDGAYLYVWGTAGASGGSSPPYLLRMKASSIATGKGIVYYHGLDKRHAPVFERGESTAVALFHDSPHDCMSELGVEYDRYLNRWLILYRCTNDSTAHPKGIWMRSAPAPWGPWSPPQTIFSASRDHGYCYFIFEPHGCPAGTPNPPGKGHIGADYGPFFIAGWTTGTFATRTRPATSTIYYTIDTFNPYGQIIAKTKLKGS